MNEERKVAGISAKDIKNRPAFQEMLVYTIHLGNDKNKTKRAKELAKKNPSNTTSFSNHSIQNSGQL